MFLESHMTGFSIRGMGSVTGQDQTYMHYPLSWVTVTEGLYDSPVKLRYEGLDTKAQYRIRIVYAGDNTRPKLRLVANEKFEVHGWLARPVPFKALEFDIPAEATAGGILNLSVFREPATGGAGRGNAVAEVWLIRR